MLIKYSIILFIFSFSLFVQGQTKFKSTKIKSVRIPENVEKELQSSLNTLEHYGTNDLLLFIVNMNNKKDLVYKDGVYSVHVSVSHPIERLFINYKNKIKLFNSLLLTDILLEYVAFIRENKIPLEIQVKYLQGIMNYIQFAYK